MLIKELITKEKKGQKRSPQTSGQLGSYLRHQGTYKTKIRGLERWPRALECLLGKDTDWSADSKACLKPGGSPAHLMAWREVETGEELGFADWLPS